MDVGGMGGWVAACSGALHCTLEKVLGMPMYFLGMLMYVFAFTHDASALLVALEARVLRLEGRHPRQQRRHISAAPRCRRR